MATGKFISYLRVSTDKQGENGLGIEAQRKAVADFLNGGNWKLVAEYVEVESGKRNDRPELDKAMHHAKVTGATLVVAKLDRLSRNVAFLAKLQEGRVKFVCADMPDANELTIHLLAAIAQHERKLISKRTKDALAVVKTRITEDGEWTSKAGNTITRLGHKDGAACFHRKGYEGNADAVQRLKAQADEHARDILPIIENIREAGITSLAGIAAELNTREIMTAHGGRWYAMTVRNLLARAQNG